MRTLQFDFGANWRSFAATALDAAKVARGREDFARLLEGVALEGKRFLDIGFGQGLALCYAAERGALATGLDVNPGCVAALEQTRRQFPGLPPPAVTVGSILDDAVVRRLGADGPFDVVYSWGVLHHTGDLRRAMANAAGLVRPGGTFVVAIYHRHWTSPAWRAVKWTYNVVPGPARTLMTWLFWAPLYAGVWLFAGDPARIPRGMDFRHDLVDWLGGYPYEYATKDEVLALAGSAFTEVRHVPPAHPTGNHQLVLARMSKD